MKISFLKLKFVNDINHVSLFKLFILYDLLLNLLEKVKQKYAELLYIQIFVLLVRGFFNISLDIWNFCDDLCSFKCLNLCWHN